MRKITTLLWHGALYSLYKDVVKKKKEREKKKGCLKEKGEYNPNNLLKGKTC